MERIQRVVGALWLGSAFFLMLTSSAVFRVAPTPGAAGDVVGAMLTRWHYVALGAPLVLFFVELRRLRPVILIVLFGAILLAASQSFVDLRIRQIRLSSPVPISSLQENSPLRRQFGALHGTSMALLLLQGIAAAIFVLSRARREPRVLTEWDRAEALPASPAVMPPPATETHEDWQPMAPGEVTPPESFAPVAGYQPPAPAEEEGPADAPPPSDAPSAPYAQGREDPERRDN
jgi:hypothetical protein